MNTWVLILMLTSGYGDAITTERFQTKAACQAAIEAARVAQGRWLHNLTGVCVEDPAPRKP